VADAVLRMRVIDQPSAFCQHYAGDADGPVTPFGFDMGPFGVEAEYLRFHCPERTARLTQVLDYFHGIKVGRCRLNLRNPSLKATGTKRLKLRHDEPLSSSSFQFKLRRFIQAAVVEDHMVFRWERDAGKGLHSSTSQLNLSRS